MAKRRHKQALSLNTPADASTRVADEDQAARRISDDGNRDVCSWSKRTGVICSFVILFHIVAVFVAPFSGPPPSSVFGRSAGDLFSPYLRALYIYNGYRFFAPNPGPSHLVRFEIDLKSGETIDGRFPDRNEQWPRLLYHRHLMLGETLFQLNSAIPSPAEFSAQQSEMQILVDRLQEEQHFDLADELANNLERERADYARLQRQQQLLLDSIANHLIARHDAETVRLFLAERPLPLPDVIQEALQDRASGAEASQTRSLPILIVDQSRWIERQVWPEQDPLPGKLIDPRTAASNSPPVPPLLQRIPDQDDERQPVDDPQQGRAGE